MFNKLFAFLLILLPILTLQKGFSYHVAKFLLPGETHSHEAQTLMQKFTHTNRVQLFCQTVEVFSFWRLFQSNRLHLEIEEGAEYNQYKEQTAHEIYQAHRERKEWNEGKAMTGEHKYIDMKKNSHICYGIYTEQAFNLTLETIHTDKWRVTKFCLGFILWQAAPHLENSERCLYGVAAFLGFQLAAWIMILVTGHLRLVLGGSLWTAFHEVLYERPTTLALACSGCFYALALACRQFDHLLCQHCRFRHVHRWILRGIAYWLIYTASDHQDIGLFCVVYLFFYSKILALLGHLFWSCIKLLCPLLPPPDRQQETAQPFFDISQLQRVPSNTADGSYVWAVPGMSNTDGSGNVAGGTTSTPVVQGIRLPNSVADHPTALIFRGQDRTASSDIYGISRETLVTSRPIFRGRVGPNDSPPMGVQRSSTSAENPRSRRNTFSTATLYHNVNYSDSNGDTRAQ
ncbi:uncharacterized protein LOC111077795 [Drosophila obscura]|uniref:uncharacterized protein LOC111077795 n=1 Tax=Drosophila obscura TaxID=7282 RepID=UPI001BB2025A|nr:uncharacterized protein LOC111077795 [Drosophila obscura]